MELKNILKISKLSKGTTLISGSVLPTVKTRIPVRKSENEVERDRAESPEQE